MPKTESVEEFLARGGTVTKCPVVEIIEKEQTVKGAAGGPAVLMSLDEAENIYGEKTTRKKKEKSVDLTGINLEDVPEELRKTLGI